MIFQHNAGELAPQGIRGLQGDEIRRFIARIDLEKKRLISFHRPVDLKVLPEDQPKGRLGYNYIDLILDLDSSGFQVEMKIDVMV
jgi:hypothetical protein